MAKRIAKVVVGLPVEGPFDYDVPDRLMGEIVPGKRVCVPFGKRDVVGFVVNTVSKSRFKGLKAIGSVLDNIPCLSSELLQLGKEFSQYYACSLGEAVETLLPGLLRKKHILKLSPQETEVNKKTQAHPMILCHDKGQVRGLYFVRGHVQDAVSKGEGIIILVPEAYQAKRVKEFIEAECTKEVVLLDKKLTPKKEFELWKVVKEKRETVVVGTRSAVFAPVNNLGLIVVLDEGNRSYKQEQSPFYNADHVARMRARIEGAGVVYVSSVPSAALYREAQQGKVSLKSIEPEGLAKMHMIDMSNYKSYGKVMVSFPLQNHIQEALLAGRKVLLLLNRKGFSTITRCSQCGFVLKCERCNVSLPFLFSKKKMVCHLCQKETDMPKVCPSCESSYLLSLGAGIEKFESELSRIFPQARITQFDKGTSSFPKEFDIIVGTHAVLKVMDEIKVDLVGVLDIDAELNRSDFRSAEKVFSLLMRLRQAAEDKIFVQTYQINNYCIKAALDLSFEDFYRREIKLRRECDLPPFRHLIEVMLRGPDESVVFEQAKALFGKLVSSKPAGVELMDFQPDMRPKLRDKYRFNIVLKGKSVKSTAAYVKGTVQEKLRRKKDVIVTINVDP